MRPGLQSQRDEITGFMKERVPASREIRSEAGRRLTFMVSVSKLMKKLLNSWHDEEAAALTAVAFGDDSVSVAAVRAARRRYIRMRPIHS